VDITACEQWTSLESRASRKTVASLKELFVSEPGRTSAMSVEIEIDGQSMLIDASKQNVDKEVFCELAGLAATARVAEARDAMLSGAIVNTSEVQPALHTALRAPRGSKVVVNGVNVVDEVWAVRDEVTGFAHDVREGRYRGATGRIITDVVNIGIGGSDLGPALVYSALSTTGAPQVRVSFVSNVDPTNVTRVLGGLDPATTIVVVCSKSFSTAETLANARIAQRWLADALGGDAVAHHTVAVTVDASKVASSGIAAARVLKMWSWVGGRYSVSSAVNVCNAIAFGADAIDQFLGGMRAMDEHFAHEPFERNAPMILGVIGVWNRSLLGRGSHAIVPYADSLGLLPSYLQQLEMESNGKAVTRDGEVLSTESSPVIWGGVGTNAQHAFMQLLHQGTSVVPVTFIGVARAATAHHGEHAALVANMIAQSAALAFGSTHDDPARAMPGNRPSTTIVLSALTPGTLGALIALFEHVVFVQGCVWGINSFDQWGVELGKKLAHEVATELASGEPGASRDASSVQLQKWYLRHSSRA
jgi:glucose-6-phosphate isomerase